MRMCLCFFFLFLSRFIVMPLDLCVFLFFGDDFQRFAKTFFIYGAYILFETHLKTQTIYKKKKKKERNKSSKRKALGSGRQNLHHREMTAARVQCVLIRFLICSVLYFCFNCFVFFFLLLPFTMLAAFFSSSSSHNGCSKLTTQELHFFFSFLFSTLARSIFGVFYFFFFSFGATVCAFVQWNILSFSGRR